VHSVASLFVSRWDKATIDKVPSNLRDKLGIAISKQAYKSYRDLLETDRWQRLAAHGAHPQRLLFASTGTKDPQASDVLYIGALAAPNTINTMPEETLLAFDAHGRIDRTLPRDGGDGDETVAAYGAGESGEGIIIPRRGLRGSRRPMRRLCASGAWSLLRWRFSSGCSPCVLSW